MTELIEVLVLKDFYKSGKGENARGFAGDKIRVSPALAEWLSERNIVEVVLEEEEEIELWQQ